MAASPYFIALQVALVASGVALLNVDWTDRSKQYQPASSSSTSKPAVAAPASRTSKSKVPAAIPVTENKVVNEPPARGEHGVDPEYGAEEVNLSGPPETTPFLDDVLEEAAADMAGYRITADTASNFNLGSHTVTFTGRVSLQSKRFDLTSARLVVHMDPAKNALKKLVATGDVKVRLNGKDAASNYNGTSYECVYDPADNSIVLSGWPQIIGQGREHRAADKTTRMVLFVDNPRLVTQGRASTKIIGTQNIDPTESKPPLALPVR
jgi:lipopolysaccharide export system protein LptA